MSPPIYAPYPQSKFLEIDWTNIDRKHHFFLGKQERDSTYVALVQTDHDSGTFLRHLDGCDWGLATTVVAGRKLSSRQSSVRIESRWSLQSFGWPPVLVRRRAVRA